MTELIQYFGSNAGTVLDLYSRYRDEHTSVDTASQQYFAALSTEALSLLSTALSAPDLATTKTNGSHPQEPLRPKTEDAAVPTAIVGGIAMSDKEQIRKIVETARLARFVREMGHMEARLDPLNRPRPAEKELTLEAHNLTTTDLQTLPSSIVGGPLSLTTTTALEALGKVRLAYSGTIGYEADHIQDSIERHWIYDHAELGTYLKDFTPEGKRTLLERLTLVDAFEQFLHKTYANTKRFSIEGTDMLVPMLDELLALCSHTGTTEAVIGMAHRGRLNVLVHVLEKPYEMILSGFESGTNNQTTLETTAEEDDWTGDVKYHLGYNRKYTNGHPDSPEVSVKLVPNPSHLEFVNAVVEGHARAAQDNRTQGGAPKWNGKESLPIVIHGDAAFPGQGIVAETLNLSRLPGYSTGGTIHLIVNNQIGFTTIPEDSRSTTYSSDLARGFEMPIVHVNADDPIACLAVVRMAFAYREQFGKDFLIDLVGYRRYGHNEGDEPAFTQPQMYAQIEQISRVRDKWAQQLENEGIVTRDESQTMVANALKRLNEARADAQKPPSHDDLENATRSANLQRETGVPAEQLIAYNEALYKLQDDFTFNAKLERSVISRRRDALKTNENKIDWGHAETLAYASVIADGTPIRLTGQDTERGTFGQRNLVLHNPTNGERYVPLENLPQSKASFAVYNSPLSENAPLGFEYGYSMHAPNVLVLWEGQFGDFCNGAQVIIDQFLISGNAKWRQTPSLVMLLPHGYEGQGPEHSSARIERFLQLAATDNIRVVNCTTAGQYFHILRRQAALLESDPRPLILFTPKSLLRDVNAATSLSVLSQGRFESVIDDPFAQDRRDKITRLILCSGKVYMNLVYTSPASTEIRKDFNAAKHIAAVRVEELYPFPTDDIRAVIANYPKLREIVWLQEEPKNMGAWTFVEPRLRDPDIVDWRNDLHYVGRPEAASPAEGFMARHNATQNKILTEVLGDLSHLPKNRRKAAAAR